jgi:hypothetical protein
MQEQQRNYWAFSANPRYYNVEEAIQDQKEGWWNVPKGNPQKGDRAII